MRVTSLVALVVSITGCLGWEEAPEGATGFLVVEDEQLTGTIGGVAIDPASTSVETAFCTELGWHVELRAEAGDQELLQVLDVQDLDMREREVSVQFVPVSDTSDNLVVDGLVEAGRMSLQVAADADLEAVARDVSLETVPMLDGDVAVRYVAELDSGDRVEGQFTMEMPITD